VSSARATQPEPAPVAKVSQPRITNTSLLMGVSAVVLLGPLAFGAVEPWSIFALEACAMLMFGVWAYRQWSNRELSILDHLLYRPMSAFFALVVVQWVVGTTVYRLVTYTHLLLYAAYGVLAFVVTQTLRRSSQFELLAKLITGYGALVASFAILQGLAPNGKLYWIWTSAQGGSIYGPYVNHNHYAGLMEMLLPFPLVLAATQFTNGSRKIVVAGIAALMAASIFLSGSRGGMTAFAVQMVLLGILLARKREGSWKQPLILGAFLALVIVFLVWMGGNELTQRLVSIHSEAREEINGGVRLTIDRDCLRMLLKRPFLGWGVGAFPIAYPEFRSFYTTFFVNQAHNDYLQLLVETGLAGFSIAIWFLVLVFRQASGKLKNWTETATGALTVAALLGCVGILVHSLFDFNLQIPANAALFYVLCAIAALAPLQESTRRRVLRRHNLIVQPTPETTVSGS
jgi:O-antigen ligase